eukprot:UN34856
MTSSLLDYVPPRVSKTITIVKPEPRVTNHTPISSLEFTSHQVQQKIMKKAVYCTYLHKCLRNSQQSANRYTNQAYERNNNQSFGGQQQRDHFNTKNSESENLGSSSISSDDQTPPYEPSFNGTLHEGMGNYTNNDSPYYYQKQQHEDVSPKRCEFFSRGGCRYGNDCAYAHVMDNNQSPQQAPQQSHTQRTPSPPSNLQQQAIVHSQISQQPPQQMNNHPQMSMNNQQPLMMCRFFPSWTL